MSKLGADALVVSALDEVACKYDRIGFLSKKYLNKFSNFRRAFELTRQRHFI